MGMDCTALSVKLRNLVWQSYGKRAARSSDMQKLYNAALANLSIWQICSSCCVCKMTWFCTFYVWFHSCYAFRFRYLILSPQHYSLSIHLSESCRPLLEPWATPPKLPWGWGSSLVSLTSSYRGPKPIILYSKKFHCSIWGTWLPSSISQISLTKLNQLCLKKKS